MEQQNSHCDSELAAPKSKPYKVGNGLYCDEVGAYETFEEALEHYARLPKPRRGEWRAIGLWNQDQVDVDDATGLTEEEQERVGEVFNRKKSARA